MEQRKTVGLLDSEPKRIESLKNVIDRKFKSLPFLDVINIKNLDDILARDFDLITVYSWNLDEKQFLQWLEGLEQRWSRKYTIWIPLLVVSRLDLSSMPELLEKSVSSNWYFDVLHPDHLSSLTIRVANMLRIHDHLRELHRYERELKLMQNQVHSIEQELNILRKGK